MYLSNILTADVEKNCQEGERPFKPVTETEVRSIVAMLVHAISAVDAKSTSLTDYLNLKTGCSGLSVRQEQWSHIMNHIHVIKPSNIAEYFTQTSTNH